MKTAISVPNPVFESAEELAAELGISRSELYSRALASFLVAHRSEGVTATLDKVYASEPSALDPVLEQIQWLSVSRDEW